MTSSKIKAKGSQTAYSIDSYVDSLLCESNGKPVPDGLFSFADVISVRVQLRQFNYSLTLNLENLKVTPETTNPVRNPIRLLLFDDQY